VTDLRSFLADLDIVEVDAEVSPEFEISAVLEEADPSGRPVLFTNVTGYPSTRIAGNLLSSRELAAKALGTTPEQLSETYVARTTQGIPPVTVSDAPCQEVVIEGPDDVGEVLPIPTYHELDAGPFLTCGVVIAKDPETGERGMGIHRMMYKGGNRFGIFLANPPLSTFLEHAEASNRPLPLAVALGVDPATLIAAVVKAGPQSPDKMHIAGALRGSAVELVAARTIDLDVPARAEIIIEGNLVPGVREEEGPFGENTGFYFSNVSPVFEATAITHRHEFIFQALKPWGSDVDTLLSLASGAEMLAQLRELIDGVRDLELTSGSCGFAAVVSVLRIPKSDVRRLIHLALALDRRIKQVTVVNEEVDVRNPREVAWALATHFRPEIDTVIMGGMEGYAIDPSAAGGTGSKIGLDASGDPADARPRVAVPSWAAERAKSILSERETS